MTATQEIELLQSLKGDTYFAQVFKPETIDAMCENIRKDFPIDCDVNIFENCHEATKARSEIRILKGLLDERENEVEDLRQQKDSMVDFLIDQASTSSDSSTKKQIYEKAAEIIGDKEVIRRKIKFGYSLNIHDLEWLAQNL